MKKEKPSDFIRTNGDYYKFVEIPTIKGELVNALIPWSKSSLIDDHGKGFISEIKRYNGFTCIPSHTDYKREIGDFYNNYWPLTHEPKEGEFPNIQKIINHVFGEYYELGLDYFQILYLYPTQKLPILCLVSSYRASGKTTLLNLLKAIFQKNTIYINNDLLNGRFNSVFMGKLLALLDEGKLTDSDVTEKIKNLTTAESALSESKGKDPIEVQPFMKFVICANNETNFIKVDDQIQRFWVLKVPRLEADDLEIGKKILNEVPAFLNFLINREISTPNVSRMWFDPKLLQTPALKKLITYNRDSDELDLAAKLITLFDDLGLEEINFCIKDIEAALSYRYNANDLRRIVKVKWGLKPQENSLSYNKFRFWKNGDIDFEMSIGRYYTLKKDFIFERFDDLMRD